ncbi:MAG: dicarboxylate/amino acid:cation symporter [Candidatus Melainabacteria bacterium]
MRAFWLFLVAIGLGTKRHWHILIAIIAGIVLGLFLPIDRGLSPDDFPLIHKVFEVVGQVFIRLITMIVIPLVVSSLVVGVTSLGDSRQLGRMGAKVLMYFLLFMLVAAVLGSVLAITMAPGEQIRSSIDTMGLVDHTAIAKLAASTPSLKELFFNMIPANPIGALANGDLVPVIIFTMFFAVAIASIGDAGKPITAFFEGLFTATMRLTDWIMVLAVPGVFSLAFVTVAKAGPEIFIKLYPYMTIILGGLLIQLLVVFPLALKLFARISVMNLYRAVSEAIMVAFGTASSSATLPITIACCERRAGISNRIASFVLPTGATINKTGTTMFEAIAVIFLAQAYGIQLTPYHLGMIIIFSIIASIGAAGVPSAGLITIAIVFKSIGITDPLVFAGGLAMIWSIDRVLDMCRTVVNVLSSCSVAAIVAAGEGELNRDILNQHEKWTDIV